MKGVLLHGSVVYSLVAWCTPLGVLAQGLAPGNVETTFDPGTGVAGSAGAGLMGVQSSGKVILGAGPGSLFESINGVSVTNLARLHSDGRVDTSFHGFLQSSGSSPAGVDHLVVLPDDRILVTGTFDQVNGEPIRQVVRMDADGNVDPTFLGSSLSTDEGGFVAPASGGKILVRSRALPGLKRLLADGTVDPSFALTNYLEAVYSFAEQTDGKLVVVGARSGSISVYRFNPDGGHDAAFHSPVFDPAPLGTEPPHLLLQPDGQVLVGGTFTNVDGFYRGSLVRLDTNGLVAPGFLPGFRGLGATQLYIVSPRIVIPTVRTVKALALQEDGKIVVGGDFAKFENLLVNGIVRLNANGSRDSQFMVGTGATSSSGVGTVASVAVAPGGFVLIAGRFEQVNDLPRRGVARLLRNQTPPTILVPPASLTLPESSPLRLSVIATGSPPLSYQWKKDGANIVGATDPSYSIAYLVTNDAASYTVVVTNFGGSTTSEPARLTVGGTPARPGTKAPLTLFRSIGTGAGVIMGATNGQLLEIGQYYTLQAWPSFGNVFSNWVGTVNSTNPTLTFVMVSDMILIANFVNNPFLFVGGNYTGLFYNTNDLPHGLSGAFNLTLNELGSFSGKWMLPDISVPISGQFGLDLHARKTMTLNASNPPIVIDLQLRVGSIEMTGSISDGMRTGQLVGYRLRFDAAFHPATAFVGYYTLAFSGGENPAASPFGHGFGAARIKPDGIVLFTGTLADGTPIVQRAPLATNGQWPVYAPLYKRRGLLLGWLTVTNTARSDLQGLLVWSKPGGIIGPLYPAGFTNEVTALGSRFAQPAAGTPVLNFRNAAVLLEGGGLIAPVTNEVVLEPRTRLTVSPPNSNRLALALNVKTGRIGGGFLDPETGKRRAIKGVLLRKSNAGAGYFLGTNQSGAVYLGLPETFPLFPVAP